MWVDEKHTRSLASPLLAGQQPELCPSPCQRQNPARTLSSLPLPGLALTGVKGMVWKRPGRVRDGAVGKLQGWLKDIGCKSVALSSFLLCLRVIDAFGTGLKQFGYSNSPNE